MNIIEITSVDDPRIAHYVSLNDNSLRSSQLASSGVFIAESPKVIQAALDNGYLPESLLCERKHIDGDAKAIVERLGPNIPVYTGVREVLAAITGYVLTRGVLCSFSRRPVAPVSSVIQDARCVAVLDKVCDTTNIGSIFRAAAALGVDAVLLTPGTCDPLNRRAIRVSMGTVFRIPWTWLDIPVDSLKQFGFRVVAMALKDNSVVLEDLEISPYEKIAVVLGTEGDGLSDETIDRCDQTVIIPMDKEVDSLNVGSAAAITFWHLRNKLKI